LHFWLQNIHFSTSVLKQVGVKNDITILAV